MEIKHWFSENFSEPESMLKEGSFAFTLTKNEVEIECSVASGVERIFIPLETLEKFLTDYKIARLKNL